MRISVLLTIVVLGLMSFPSRAFAQLRMGERVRMTSEGTTFADGTFLGTDSLHYLVLTGEGDTTRVLRTDPQRIERLRGREPYGMSALLKGAAIGAGIGVALAGTVALSPDPHHENGVGYAIAAIVGTVTTVVGSVVGLLIATTERDVWEVVQ